MKFEAKTNDNDNKNYGKVPKYLQKYKEEAKIKEDAKVEAKKQAEILRNQPAGTKLMPEKERLETLAQLRENKEEVNKLLARMPISMQTTSMQRQKKELEDKLMQIEKAITVMSKTHVYVQE